MGLDLLRDDALAFAGELLTIFEPPPDLKVSEWAQAHRIIPRGNAEPGRWSNDRAPYLVEPMDCCNDDSIHTIAITGCSQGGKTALCENVAGFTAHFDPATILWAVPNEDACDNAAERFDGIISATAEMRKRFKERSARSRVNNSRLKSFLGGKLVFASAGSPSSLASHPARVVIADELDRWPVSLRKEGDPTGVIRARMTTFARPKFYALSSPTQEGVSRIEGLHADGDQREWHWRCDCGAEHVPEWEHVEFDPGKAADARYHMPCCGLILTDAERWDFMRRGRWIPTAEGQPGVRSYRFRGLSSPWLKLGLLASEFDAARGSPLKLAPFYNTRLGLPFDQGAGEGLDAYAIRELAEDYRGDVVPDGACVVVAGVDVQGSWLACQVVAFGTADEAWSLQWHEIPGDPLDPRTWAALEAVLTQKLRHASGAEMGIEAVAVDAGFQSQAVHEFSAKHRARGLRWFATIGRSGPGKPLWRRGGDIARSLAKWFVVGIDLGKAQVMAGVATAEPGPGKWHTRSEFPEHFFEWLTAEELVTEETRGGPKAEWKLKKGKRRNEVLDTAVLALAARYSFEVNVGQRLDRLASSGTIKPPTVDYRELAKKFAAVSG